MKNRFSAPNLGFEATRAALLSPERPAHYGELGSLASELVKIAGTRAAVEVAREELEHEKLVRREIKTEQGRLDRREIELGAELVALVRKAVATAAERLGPDTQLSPELVKGEILQAFRESVAATGGTTDENMREVERDVERIVEIACEELRTKKKLEKLDTFQARLLESKARDPEGTARIQAVVEHIIRASKLVVLPPPGTAANTEALVMAMAYAFLPVWRLNVLEEDGSSDEFTKPGTLFVEMLEQAELNNQSVARFRKAIDPLVGHDDAEELHVFAREWCLSSFARLEVGHKLAAALALTDVPEELEVRAPWLAWSLSIPDGLFDTPELGHFALRRIWCVGAEPVFGVTNTGEVQKLPPNGESTAPPGWSPAQDAADVRTRSAVRALARGACLALSDPEEFRRETGSSSGSSRKAKGRKGPPELEQARFLLSRPLEIDLRGELARALSGARGGGGSPTVQFLVRGHWRQQAHGARHSLRKTIWIQPFWKGPEESRVLLRRAHVDGEPKP